MDGKSGGAWAGDKERDDEVVKGEREGKEGASDNAWRDDGDEHFPSRGPGVCAKVAGGFQDGQVKVLQSRQYGHGHIAGAEGDVRDRHRGQAKFDFQGDEKEQQADAKQDFRHD